MNFVESTASMFSGSTVPMLLHTEGEGCVKQSREGVPDRTDGAATPFA